MMREPVDLRRAVKEEVGRDLADFTFTPAMQERVMAQLHKRPRSRLTWLYPASAAAAVLLILATTMSTQLKQEKAQELATTAGSATQEVAPVAPATNANTNADAANAKSAIAPSSPPPVETKDQSDGQQSTGITAFGVGSGPDSSAPALVAPGPMSKMMGKRSVAGPQLAALPSEHLVVTLTNGAVTRVDQTGAPVWQVALPATLQAEQVAAAPNGKLVVSAGTTVLLLGPDGSMLESLQLTEPAQQITTGTNDRLALVSEQIVYERQAAGQPLVAIAQAGVSAAAFTPDGLLVLATPDGLAAYGPNGNRRWLATGDGGQLLISPDGKTLLWGNSLYRYDANGAEASPLEPASGVVAGGPGLLRWDGEQLKGFTWAGKQAWTWTAQGFIASVYRGEGDRIWVVLDTPEGIKLQELQGTTGRLVGRAQSLPAIPQEATVVDGKLYLRLPEGLTILPL